MAELETDANRPGPALPLGEARPEPRGPRGLSCPQARAALRRPDRGGGRRRRRGARAPGRRPGSGPGRGAARPGRDGRQGDDRGARPAGAPHRRRRDRPPARGRRRGRARRPAPRPAGAARGAADDGQHGRLRPGRRRRRRRGVLTTGDNDPWHPDALRGAAGLHFALPVAAIEAIPQGDRPLIAVDPGGEDLRPGAIPPRAILAFGTERHGLSSSLLERADARVGIPMREGVSSLNLATSVAAVLFSQRL